MILSLVFLVKKILAITTIAIINIIKKIPSYKKILIEADEAIRVLTSEEQEKLAYEFAQYKGICGLYKIIK